jgi:magnesium chelatase family protein
LDRIDIHIEVPRVDYEKLGGDRMGETSASIRARVQAARDIQTKRYSPSGTVSSIRNSNTELSNIVCNADMRVGEIRQFCKLQDEGQSLMRAAMSQLNLSARAYHRILKLARTIADLAGGTSRACQRESDVLQTREAGILSTDPSILPETDERRCKFGKNFETLPHRIR